MIFSIVFDKTGDIVPLRAINPEMVVYYVESLNQKKLNSFSAMPNKITDLPELVRLFNNTVENCKELTELIEIPFSELTLNDAMDQQLLNQLHSTWVSSQLINFNISLKRQNFKSGLMDQVHRAFSDDITDPPVGTVISALGFEKEYSKINTHIHQIEEVFNLIRFKIDNQDWVSFDNPFGSSVTSNDIANFSLSFNHLGRTLYNKFNNFDIGNCTDENTYNELLGFVSVRLIPPQTIPLSAEYIAWCQQYNKTPSGNNLNLGNIVDLHDRIMDYRTLFFRNIQNNFSIQL